MKKPMIMFAEDGGAVSATALVVPEVASAAPAMKVETVDIPANTGVIKAAESLGLAVPGIQGPKEALGEDPEEIMDKMDQSMGKAARERGEDGKFLPKGKEKTDKVVVKKVEKPDKLAAKAPEKPAVDPVKPVEKQPEVAKVKIGDKEMTPDEIAAKLKELEEKTNPPKPADEKKTDPSPVAKKPEEIEAETKKLDEDFISQHAKTFATEEEFDKILSGGPEALDLFSRKIISSNLETRKHIATEVNKAINDIYSKLDPALKLNSQIEQYRNESSFLDANPDIKSNPKGAEESRVVRDILHKQYADIQQKVSQGQASKEEQAFALMYEAKTPESFNNDVAYHVRQRLQINPATAAPAKTAEPAPASKVEPKPAPAASKPFNGDRPGGSAPPKGETSDARALREMTEHGV